jgi:hypothetical protein
MCIRCRAAFTIAAGTFLLTGCSVPTGARDSAKQVSLTTLEIQRRVADFAQAQADIDRERLASLQRLRRSAVVTANHVDRELEIIRMALGSAADKDPRITLFEGVRRESDGEAERNRTDRLQAAADAEAVSQLRGVIQSDGDRLGRIAKAMAELSEKKGVKDSATFLIGFGQDVSKALKKLRDDAATESKEAKTDLIQAEEASSHKPAAKK